MAQATTNITKAEVSRNNQVTYEERTLLFGLVKWLIKVNEKKIQDDLIIFTDTEICDVYLNGTKLNRP